ncbi:MAG: tetratricopeptide repeat protein [Chloroflexota bacterium]
MSREKPRSQTDTIDDHLSTLIQELQLANKWKRPSILLVSYRSNLALLDSQTSLEIKLHELKQIVVHIEVTNINFDIPLYLSQLQDCDKIIFFIRGFSNGGGSQGLNAYRALNMRRELLVNHHIRAVFWMNAEETRNLTAHAIDFWSFRHRMIELLDQPNQKRINNLVKNLSWSYWDELALLKDMPNGLPLRQRILNEISGDANYSALQAELLLTLAAYQWAQNRFTGAFDLVNKGREIAEKISDIQLQSRFWIATGQIYQRNHNLKQAVATYKKSLQLDPDSAEAWRNLSLVYHSQKDTPAAQAAITKSIELDPKAAWAWRDLGDIQRGALLLNEAIQSYKKSLTLNKKDAASWGRLGDTYLILGRTSEALQPYLMVKDLAIQDPTTWINLGGIYNELGLINKAVRAFHKSARLGPLNTLPWKKLGEIYQITNRIRSARKAYKKALSLDPTNQELQFALQTCYKKNKQ